MSSGGVCHYCQKDNCICVDQAVTEAKRQLSEAQNEIKLLPCPFCGNEPIYRPREPAINDILYHADDTISCEPCGTTYVDGGKQKERLVEWWNTRA